MASPRERDGTVGPGQVLSRPSGLLPTFCLLRGETPRELPWPVAVCAAISAFLLVIVLSQTHPLSCAYPYSNRATMLWGVVAFAASFPSLVLRSRLSARR